MGKRGRIWLKCVWLSILTFQFVTVLLIANTAWQNYPADGTYVQLNGKILGGDFLTFYNAGRIAGESRERLYDLGYQQRTIDEFLGAENAARGGELPYVYPPLIAAFHSMFASLTYKVSQAAWMLSALIAGLSSVALLSLQIDRAFFKRRWPIVMLGVLGYVPFLMNTVIGSQMSWVGIVLLAGTSTMLMRGRHFAAGLLFSLSFYKPPLFLFALLALLLTQPREFCYGFSTGAIVVVLLSWLYVGSDGLVGFVSVASSYTYGENIMPDTVLPVAQGAGIYAPIFMLAGSTPAAQAMIILLNLLLLAFVVRVSRQGQELPLLLALIFTISVGLSIQCIRYDLSIMLVPFVMLVARHDFLQKNSRMMLLGIAGFYLEWLCRDVSVGSGVFHLSSLLFPFMIYALAKNLFPYSRRALRCPN